MNGTIKRTAEKKRTTTPSPKRTPALNAGFVSLENLRPSSQKTIPQVVRTIEGTSLKG